MVLIDLLGKGFVRAVIAVSTLTFILFLLQRTLPVIGVLAGIAIPFLFDLWADFRTPKQQENL